MKIGLFNNMNNNNFALARYLRDRGHDVTLFLLNEQPQFTPENDTYEAEDLKMVQTLNWYEVSHWKTTRREIQKTVEPFEFLIGTDMIPAYFYKAGICLDLMFPHGGDIYSKPYFKFNRSISLRAQVGPFYETYCQRSGLRSTRTVSLQYLNERFEFHLRKLRITSNRSLTVCPSIYIPQYSTASYLNELKHNKYYHQVLNIKTTHELLIIQQGRQEHSDPTNIHYKGNEKLFTAFKKLIHNQDVNAHLVLFEYGTDVEASKKIIEQYQISDHVTWLPLMARKLLMPVLSLADVGIGILAEESYVLYGSVNEFLVMGVPFIHHLDLADAAKQGFTSLYTYYEARTAEEVLNSLLKVVSEKTMAKSNAVAGQHWFKENVINNSMNNIISLIKQKEFRSKVEKI